MKNRKKNSLETLMRSILFSGCTILPSILPSENLNTSPLHSLEDFSISSLENKTSVSRYKDFVFSTQPSTEELISIGVGNYRVDPLNIACSGQEINPRTAHVFLPPYGLNPTDPSLLAELSSRNVPATTGLLLFIDGLGVDCSQQRNFYGMDIGSPSEGIPDFSSEYNVILANFEHRNIERVPADYGKYGVVDVLRGIGAVLSQYPEIDTRRIYVVGGSGGGLVTLELSHIFPELFAEMYASKGITKLTLASEVGSGKDFPMDTIPWGEVNGWASSTAPFSSQGLTRIQAERDLRSPLEVLSNLSVSEIPHGSAGTLPVIGIFHGDADVTVGYAHFDFYKSLFESKVGDSSLVLDTPYVTRWENGNYTFIKVKGAGHGMDTAKGIWYNFPNAFRSVRPSPPRQSLSKIIPSALGYALDYEGKDLDTITVTTIPYGNSSVTGWIAY